jgi:hypothetical protein
MTVVDDQVTRNLAGMDELDFTGWNWADWDGVFARHHTSDVLVYIKGKSRPMASRSIDAMKDITGGAPERIASHPIEFG